MSFKDKFNLLKNEEKTMNIYSLYDSRSASYSDPLIFVNDAVAIRAYDNHASRLKNESNSNPPTWFTYPADFTLYKIGKYNFDRPDLSQPIEVTKPVSVIKLSSINSLADSESDQ